MYGQATQEKRYAATAKSDADLPLMEYATREINRLTSDIAHEIANLNGFVDSVLGSRPQPLKDVGVAGTSVTAAPYRGEALREAIRALQNLRNDTVEAVARLGGI